MINEKNILIIDDDVETSLKYQKWLEAEQEEEVDGEGEDDAEESTVTRDCLIVRSHPRNENLTFANFWMLLLKMRLSKAN